MPVPPKISKFSRADSSVSVEGSVRACLSLIVIAVLLIAVISTLIGWAAEFSTIHVQIGTAPAG
ncbi:hypothetical protein D3C87_1739210 [compost metagenome]